MSVNTARLLVDARKLVLDFNQTIQKLLNEIERTTLWKPIDTAPRDGTLILGKAGEDIAVTAWNYDFWSVKAGDVYLEDSLWFPTEWKPIE